MAPVRNLSLSLLLLATGPLAGFLGLACGGGKPPETPADESSSGDDSGAPAASSSADMPAASGSAASDDSTAAPAASSAAPAAAAAPPPAPALGDSDCGKCIDKTCTKPAAACGKNTDCQAVIDAIHGCNGTAGSCIDGATPPTAKKPKALAAAYGKCAKKAISKACKSQCQ